MTEGKRNRWKTERRERMAGPRREKPVDLTTDCKYEGVEISYESIVGMIQKGQPMIEVNGILYLPVARVEGKEGKLQ